MQYQQYRHAYVKLGVFRFVAKQLHTGIDTEAAADGSNTHQRCFRNAPCIFLCFQLVRKHKNQARGIDYKQICYQHKLSYLSWGDCYEENRVNRTGIAAYGLLRTKKL